MDAVRAISGPWRAAIAGAALVIGQQVAARALRDALFLSVFDVSLLPVVGGVTAVVSLFAVFGFARSMTRFGPARVVPAAVVLSALLLVAEWGLAARSPRAAALVLYLHMGLFGATLVSAFWSLLNEAFDPYSARRAFGLVGTGGSLGGALGGVIIWQGAQVMSVRSLLLVAAALTLATLVPVAALRRAVPEAPPVRDHGEEVDTSIVRLPYFRNLALLVTAAAFLDTLVDYAFNAAAARAIPRGQALAVFFAGFHAVTGALTLAVGALLTRPALARLGIGPTLAVQPAVVAVAGALSAWAFSLPAAVLLRGAHAVLRNSLFRSAYELLYMPLPQARKRLAKPAIDVGCDRLGTVLANGAILAVLAVAAVPVATVVVAALAATTAATMVVLAPWLRRGYVAGLAESLRTGAVSVDESEVLDPMTRTLLDLSRTRGPGSLDVAPAGPPAPDPLLQAVAELHSGDAGRVRAALAGTVDRRLIGHVIPLLRRDDLLPEVVAALRRSGAAAIGQFVDVLLDAEADATVRRRIPRVLKAFPVQRAFDGLFAALGPGTPFEVRYRATQALSLMRAANPGLAVREAEVVEAAARELEAPLHPRSVEQVFALLGLVLEKEALQTALRALRRGDLHLRGTALEYLDNVLP
ncbi:MAG TPA: hypothetical protein VFM29_04695, partial [Vicinamibacteria bacterium]|nr:hypothetical protein [Vicinamibacteria bacterium]